MGLLQYPPDPRPPVVNVQPFPAGPLHRESARLTFGYSETIVVYQACVALVYYFREYMTCV